MLLWEYTSVRVLLVAYTRESVHSTRCLCLSFCLVERPEREENRETVRLCISEKVVIRKRKLRKSCLEKKSIKAVHSPISPRLLPGVSIHCRLDASHETNNDDT